MQAALAHCVTPSTTLFPCVQLFTMTVRTNTRNVLYLHERAPMRAHGNWKTEIRQRIRVRACRLWEKGHSRRSPTAWRRPSKNRQI